MRRFERVSQGMPLLVRRLTALRWLVARRRVTARSFPAVEGLGGSKRRRWSYRNVDGSYFLACSQRDLVQGTTASRAGKPSLAGRRARSNGHSSRIRVTPT